MSSKPPKRIPRVRDPENLFERDARGIFDGLSRTEIMQGQLVVDVDIATTSTQVAHRLGRIPKGFLVVDLTADSRIYRDTAVTTERTTYLYLKATTATTVSLWVF